MYTCYWQEMKPRRQFELRIAPSHHDVCKCVIASNHRELPPSYGHRVMILAPLTLPSQIYLPVSIPPILPNLPPKNPSLKSTNMTTPLGKEIDVLNLEINSLHKNYQTLNTSVSKLQEALKEIIVSVREMEKTTKEVKEEVCAFERIADAFTKVDEAQKGEVEGERE